MKVYVDEKYGSELVRTYGFDTYSTEGSLHINERQKGTTGNALLRIRRLFTTIFLPQGYPESVSEDYLEYQAWDTAQAFCSSITGTLATRAVLKGYGVGDETATATAATITWMLRNGTGMLGNILFAWGKGAQLDCDAKRWRLFADILNDLAILLDLLSPLFKGYFTLIACLSGIAKSIVGVAGGATRAALTQHQARRDNMADVSAKDGSQETLVNLMALIAGLIITPLVANSALLVWALFAIFTFLHLYCNYKAVSAVVMETVNLPRYHILVKNYLKHLRIMTPKDVGKLDPVLLAPGYKLRIKIGCNFSDVIQNGTEFNNAVANISKPSYVIRMDIEKGKKSGSLSIALQKDNSTEDLLRCCFQAFLLDTLMQYGLETKSFTDTTLMQGVSLLQSKWDSGNESHQEFSWEIVSLASNVSSKIFPSFYESLKQHGWNMNITQFGSDEWRFEWENRYVDTKVL